jgi:CDP-diacylglycerol--glycerol-3-phosphate 3-phosphatidyltransferase
MAIVVAGPSGLMRHVPNVLSGVRIACAPALLLLAIAGEQSAYTWLLVPALLTDAADGWIARAWGLQSKLGARLDSLGDSLIWWAGLAGLLAFQRDVLAQHKWLIGTAVAAWLLENLLALFRYGRLSSFHTRLSKVAGVLLGICIVEMFVFGALDWLLYAAVLSSIAASLEEMWLLALLPEWRADVQGVWCLRNSRTRLRSGSH